MTWYRRYKAAYPFDARSETELSMKIGDTLLVTKNNDGTWPPPEKWMQGYNEISKQTGEFPADVYVDFLEEFVVEPDPPPPLPPEKEPVTQPPPLPSPRHVGTQEYETQGRENDTWQSGGGREEEEEVREQEDEVAPPPPPRRSLGNTRAVENHVGGSRSQLPPQAPPRPTPRKRSSMDSTRTSSESRGSLVTTPTHHSGKHSWVSVTFRIPVQCSSCKLFCSCDVGLPS